MPLLFLNIIHLHITKVSNMLKPGLSVYLQYIIDNKLKANKTIVFNALEIKSRLEDLYTLGLFREELSYSVFQIKIRKFISKLFWHILSDYTEYNRFTNQSHVEALLKEYLKIEEFTIVQEFEAFDYVSNQNKIFEQEVLNVNKAQQRFYYDKFMMYIDELVMVIAESFIDNDINFVYTTDLTRGFQVILNKYNIDYRVICFEHYARTNQLNYQP